MKQLVAERLFAVAMTATLAGLGLMVPAAGGAQPPGLAAQLDEIMSTCFPATDPGAAVLVGKKDEVLFRKGYGLANLEHQVPAVPDTVFRIASMTKQFTAVAVLMLAEQGKLRLEDEITKFLPDYPTHGSRITITHLLGHQSGIYDYADLPEIADGMRQDVTLDELIAMFKDRPLDFEPGTQMAYSSSGYILLGAIIEKVSGQSYADFIEQRVFKPAGMTHSLYENPERIVPHRAAGYERKGNEFCNARFVTPTEAHAAGALISTVDDMFKWDQALHEGRLIKPETLELAWAPLKLKDGTETDSACGWGISELRGRKVLIHAGGWFGFYCYGLTMPAERLYVVVLTNGPARRPGLSNVVAQLAAAALGEPYERRPAIEFTPEALERYTGVYASSTEKGSIMSGGEWRIIREGNQLMLRTSGGVVNHLVPVSETESYIAERFPVRLRFSKNQAGQVTQFVIDWPLGPAQTCSRVEE